MPPGEADYCQHDPKDGSPPRGHLRDGADISGSARRLAVLSPSHDHEHRDQGHEDGSVGLERGQAANQAPPMPSDKGMRGPANTQKRQRLPAQLRPLKI